MNTRRGSLNNAMVAALATAVQPEPVPVETQRRKRGQGDVVAVTIRLSRGDWERLHGLALTQGESLQGLVDRGLSLVLAEHGLPIIGPRKP